MFDLSPVNREEQVCDFVRACVNNRRVAAAGGDRKQLLFPVCSQMFGSGKTTFGRILAGLGKIDGLADYCVSKLGDESRLVVDDIRNCTLVRVDCTALEPNWSFIREQHHIQPQLQKSVDRVLQFLILSSIQERFPRWGSSKGSADLRPADVFKQELPTAAAFAKHVCAVFDQKPIILHFDEVGIIESKEFREVCALAASEDPKFASDEDRQKRDAIFCHYEVWKFLTEFMLQNNVFVLYTGRSLAVGLIGSRLDCQQHGMNSPSQVCQLILPPLQAVHLTKIIQNTLVDGVSYRFKVFNNGEEHLVDCFVKECMRVTSGIPRLIESILDFLRRSVICTESHILQIFSPTSSGYASIRDSRGLNQCFWVADHASWKTVANIMMTLAVLEVPITLDSNAANGKSYAEIVERLGLFVAPAGKSAASKNLFLLVLPVVVRDSILARPDGFLLPEVEQLLKGVSMRKGDALEDALRIMLRLTLECRFSGGFNLSILFPCLEDESLQKQFILADWEVPRNGYQFVDQPKVTNNAKGSKKGESVSSVLGDRDVQSICDNLQTLGITHKTMLPRDFSKILQKQPRQKWIFWFPLPQSKSPDVLLSRWTAKPNRLVLIGLQTKHWKNDVPWDTEFDKLVDIAPAASSFLKTKQVILVQLGISIRNDDRNVYSHARGLTIVLGKQDLIALFGEHMVTSLRNIP
eukprot:ANDGO_06013.mRNA.1 hypothetical protein CAOG_08497